MWRIERVRAKDLCSFRDLDFGLQPGVTSLLSGINRDNESQQSNGSGKSSLIEAIALGLTGTPLRRVRTEETIRDLSESSRIVIDLHNGSNEERMRVARTFSRKGASCVELVVNSEAVVLPGVDEYNRAILERLGVTKEDLLNTFILSKHRFVDFISAPDGTKKEIINRFANGVLVDEAIEAVKRELIPVADELRERQMRLSNFEGRIAALNEQIESERSASEARSLNRKWRMEQICGSIAEKEDLLVKKRESLLCVRNDLAVLGKRRVRLSKLAGMQSKGDESVLLGELYDFMAGCGYGVNDWRVKMCACQAEMSALSEEIEALEHLIAGLKAKLSEMADVLECKKAGLTDFIRNADMEIKEIECEIAERKGCIASLQKSYGDVQHKLRLIGRELSDAEIKLSGSVVCPKCEHRFILSVPDMDVTVLEKQVLEKRSEMEGLKKMALDIECDLEVERREVESLIAERGRLQEEVSSGKRSVSDFATQVSENRQRYAELEKGMSSSASGMDKLQAEISNILGRAFGESKGLLERDIESNSREESALEADLRNLEGSVEVLNDTLKDVSNVQVSDVAEALKSALHECEKLMNGELQETKRVERYLSKLEKQVALFGEFSGFLANSKIDALNRITNEFLEKFECDLRVKFSSSTTLKSGKMRDKISVSLLRDGVDAGSFGKFSEGEKARINLAVILAMQRLVNSSCDAGKGLDLLILDEILESVDESGLANMFEALNGLCVTSLVVSHGGVAENYPYSIVVVKENGVSSLHG